LPLENKKRSNKENVKKCIFCKIKNVKNVLFTSMHIHTRIHKHDNWQPRPIGIKQAN